MSLIRFIHILLLLLFAVLSVPASAQNNPYKIDDSLFPLFQRATKWRATPQGLLIADTMYVEATKKKDKKAQCLALTIPVNYYFGRDDCDKMELAATNLRTESRKNDYLQYYYFASMYEINWLLNHGRSLLALQKAEEMKTQAFKDQHAFGIFSCIRALGNIHFMRGNEDLAAEYYKSALDYMLDHLPDQDPCRLYLHLARYCRKRESKDFGSALAYAEKAFKASKTNENRIAALQDKCVTLFRMKNIDEFNASYEECAQMVARYGAFQDNLWQVLRVYKLVMDKNYDQALIAVDSVGALTENYSLRELIHLRSGDYEKAYEYVRLRQYYNDSVNRLVQTSDLAELNAQIGNERMKLDAQALEFKNTQLNLKNTQLELEHAKSQVELEKINTENSKLTLENRNLELARLNVEAEQQKTLLKEQQIVSRHRVVTLSLITLFLFIFICLLMLYLYKRRKAMAKLQEKNEELIVARDCAEQSDKMKMFFIQNMSHEIRTPLNAIVGFSQILSIPDMELDEEEKQEYSLRIQQSSDLLTTLVDDLLDLASLESGKYTMHVQPHRCNELCRSAIATVEHRKPQDVNLRFTSELEDDYQIDTDEKRLKQVLINFLTNAEKYTKHGEIHLHCSLTENPGKVTFSVADTGSGIPADKADSIFERFNKLDEFKQGTGLGLNICSIIAERLNGEVKLDKDYTGGARFVFIHPLN